MRFKNLAGDDNCDAVILDELKLAQIPWRRTVRVESEVRYSVFGHLGEYFFSRKWNYWALEGLVPLSVAKKIFENPIGKTDVRAEGDCTAPDPDTCIKWVTDDGQLVLDTKAHAQFEKLEKDHPALAAKIRWRDEILFAEDPSKHGKAFVQNYHIDTDDGLVLLTKELVAAGLDKPGAVPRLRSN